MPVQYKIQPLPNKISLKFSSDKERKDTKTDKVSHLALIGDPVTVTVKMQKDRDILLKSFSCCVYETESQYLFDESSLSQIGDSHQYIRNQTTIVSNQSHMMKLGDSIGQF